MLRARSRTVGVFAWVLLRFFAQITVAAACGHASSPGASPQRNDASTSDAAVDADIEQPEVRSGQASWTALPGDQSFRERDLTHWVLSWSQWYMSVNSCDTAETDLDGFGCGLYQDPSSSTFFLTRGEYLTVRTQCRVSRNVAVLVPIIFFVAGLTPSPFAGDSSTAELEQQAYEIAETMRDITFQVDGVDMPDLERHRIDPIQFTSTVPVEPNRLSCEGHEGVSGDVGPFFVAGYFALLPPGAVGRHVVTYGGTYSRNGIDVVDRVETTLSIE